jgi:hypothetical protein
MEYINAERAYFSSFIEGGSSQMDHYIAKKMADGEWGDDIEIQALSEVY